MSRDGENEVRTTNILSLLLDHGAEVADKHNVQQHVFMYTNVESVDTITITGGRC